MIKADFCRRGGEIVGFKVSGHAGYGHAGEDIVCAAVSSACFMTANGITDCAGLVCDIQIDDDGEMKLTCFDRGAKLLLDSLYLHLTQLAQQYQQYLIITNTEV